MHLDPDDPYAVASEAIYDLSVYAKKVFVLRLIAHNVVELFHCAVSRENPGFGVAQSTIPSLLKDRSPFSYPEK